ncbi:MULTISPECIES: hypothetical protein [Cyanophyceae]|uniref:hypothetical protein n=1 Tax=Cyanophyceae TaxID=3028117 RepID=UPI0016887D7D|nr:hypothetical protein [Trichocoleus sp. FACHB-69]MBD1930445.1 hypothetical protein [Trichocoleus sp. FACHB-69]
MSKTSSERVSIRQHHLDYLKTFGQALGTSDLTEVVNHVLNCHRLGCGNVPTNPNQNSVQTLPKSQPEAQVKAATDDDLIDALGDLLTAA